MVAPQRLTANGLPGGDFAPRCTVMLMAGKSDASFRYSPVGKKAAGLPACVKQPGAAEKMPD
jgi:hypothetical protein